MLMWAAPGDDGNIGTAFAYDLRYSTTEINDTNWNSAVQVIGMLAPTPAGTVQTFIATALLQEQHIILP